MAFRSSAQRRAVFAKLNPHRGKNLKQLWESGVNIPYHGDIDKDSVPNSTDPQPLNNRVPSKKELKTKENEKRDKETKEELKE